MNVKSIVFCHGLVEKTCLRHIPIWEKFSDRIAFVSPEEDRVDIKGYECLFDGVSEHSGHSIVDRMIYGMKNAFEEGYDYFVLLEYDAFVLRRPEEFEGFQGNVFYDSNPGWFSNFFCHFPWVFSRESYVKFLQSVSHDPYCGGYADRWIAPQLTKAEIPVKDFLAEKTGYSFNTIEDYEEPGFKKALAEGAYAVHGIKSESALRLVLEVV
jgi:hypothetical protein